MRIKNILVKNFRSYDSTGVEIEELGKVNIFIGKNNSGKSNLLRFLKQLSLYHDELNKFPNKNLEDQFRRNGQSVEFSLSFKASEMFIYYKPLEKKYNPDDLFQITVDLDKMMGLNGSNRRGIKTSIDNIEHIADLMQLKADNTSYIRADKEIIISDIYDVLVPAIIRFISKTFKDLIYIPHFRQINKNEDNELDSKNINGDNIINKMFLMQNPRIGEESQKAKFLEIQGFVRELIGVNDLNIEIPHDRSTIIMEMHGNRLPLESFGTGIHEMVILCSALSIYENYIVCIEEPEIHLHPELQRKFIDFIQRTNNTYFITSHSNVFLDYSEKVNIYHVSYDRESTKISKCLNNSTSHLLLDDLHYKASSILQSNSIIWVEGPSDRIYINKWISILEPELKEGLHYTIMFYGGRLLSHLSMIDDEREQLITLLKINRNSIIVIDRDGNTDDAAVNATKKRIETETNRGICWITEGREIENYLTPRTIQDYATHKCNYHETISFRKSAKIENILSNVDASIKYAKNKVKYSKEIIDFIYLEDLDTLDLRIMISEVILKIKTWNNLI